MAPVWALSMPWQGWNTLYLFLAALLLLWTIHAVRRLVKVFRLRASVLSSRMVQVRGLGSYLDYFSSATAQHVNYMIHTRQVEPPSTVRNLHVPFTLQSVKLHPGGQLEIEMWSSVPCRLMIMSYVRSDVFKAKAANDSFDYETTSPVLLPNNKKVIPAAGGSSSSSGGHFWWVDQLRQRSTGGPSKEHFLQRSGCCAATSTTMEVPTGTRVVKVQVPMPLSAPSDTADNLPLSPLTAAAVALPSRVEDGDVERIDVVVAAPADDVEAAAPAPGTVLLGVLVVPLGPPAHSTSRLSPSSASSSAPSPSPSPSPSAGAWPASGEGDDGSSAGCAPLEFGLAVMSAPANLLPQSKVSLLAPSSPPPLAADAAPAALAPVEFIMSVAGGNLLTAVEIFGLGSVQAQVPGSASGGFLSAAFTSPEKLLGTGGGGGGTADSGRGDAECVVCLEAAKEVLLLPCRHMCVCSTCLTHIDKCPVCRASFEEYIQMLRHPPPPQDDDAGSAGAEKNAPNSDQGGVGLLASMTIGGGVARRIDFADADGTNTASL